MIERISVSSVDLPSDDWSSNPKVTRDGRLALFQSLASNLVPDDTNPASDVLVDSGDGRRWRWGRLVG